MPRFHAGFSRRSIARVEILPPQPSRGDILSGFASRRYFGSDLRGRRVTGAESVQDPCWGAACGAPSVGTSP
jgi:hypothetical protein